MRKYTSIRSEERNRQLAMPSFSPDKLLFELARRLKTRTDSQLAKRLNLDPAMICRFRKKEEYLTSNMIVSIMDETDLTLMQIRAYAGVSK